jgi:hypothetical protein
VSDFRIRHLAATGPHAVSDPEVHRVYLTEAIVDDIVARTLVILGEESRAWTEGGCGRPSISERVNPQPDSTS